MNLLFEDMIRVETSTLICRIWRARSSPDSNAILETLTLNVLMDGWSISQMAEKIIASEGVNSVEVLYRSTGCGVCIHKDWP